MQLFQHCILIEGASALHKANSFTAQRIKQKDPGVLTTVWRVSVRFIFSKIRLPSFWERISDVLSLVALCSSVVDWWVHVLWSPYFHLFILGIGDKGWTLIWLKEQPSLCISSRTSERVCYNNFCTWFSTRGNEDVLSKNQLVAVTHQFAL